MNFNKRTIILLTTIIIGSSLSLWLRRIYEPLPALPETIIVGTSADYPPFEYKKDQDIVGFDIDVIQEATKRLGKTIALKDTPFELLIPQAQAGTIHVIAANLSITPARERRVLFTQPYLSETLFVIVTLKTQPAINSLEKLTNKRVVVNAGYTADAYISKLEHVAVEKLPTVDDAINALKNGNADAFVTAANTVPALFELYGSDMFTTFVINESNESAALAVSKLYPKLREQLNQMIDQMIADGTLEQFKQKWNLQ